jgi:hypothetical protein
MFHCCTIEVGECGSMEIKFALIGLERSTVEPKTGRGRAVVAVLLLLYGVVGLTGF